MVLLIRKGSDVASGTRGGRRKKEGGVGSLKPYARKMLQSFGMEKGEERGGAEGRKEREPRIVQLPAVAAVAVAAAAAAAVGDYFDFNMGKSEEEEREREKKKLKPALLALLFSLPPSKCSSLPPSRGVFGGGGGGGGGWWRWLLLLWGKEALVLRKKVEEEEEP